LNNSITCLNYYFVVTLVSASLVVSKFVKSEIQLQTRAL